MDSVQLKINLSNAVLGEEEIISKLKIHHGRLLGGRPELNHQSSLREINRHESIRANYLKRIEDIDKQLLNQ